MTGYGRGEKARDGLKATVEMSSVNRRQSEIQLNLPREIDPLESRIRDDINRHIARGRLAVRVTLHASDSSAARRVRFNVPLARAYASGLDELRKSLKWEHPISLETVLKLPGVVEVAEEDADSEALWPLIRHALRAALEQLSEMRAKEGKHLARELKRRIASMRRLTAKVGKAAPQVGKHYRAQLLGRLRSAGIEGIDLDDERLLKEVALFADRSDITEELTRLESHYVQFDECVLSDRPVGRTLDFLAQEINREVNTIASKANHAGITRHAVLLKSELEKFREQVQNVE